MRYDHDTDLYLNYDTITSNLLSYLHLVLSFANIGLMLHSLDWRESVKVIIISDNRILISRLRTGFGNSVLYNFLASLTLISQWYNLHSRSRSVAAWYDHSSHDDDTQFSIIFQQFLGGKCSVVWWRSTEPDRQVIKTSLVLHAASSISGDKYAIGNFWGEVLLKDKH